MLFGITWSGKLGRIGAGVMTEGTSPSDVFEGVMLDELSGLTGTATMLVLLADKSCCRVIKLGWT